MDATKPIYIRKCFVFAAVAGVTTKRSPPPQENRSNQTPLIQEKTLPHSFIFIQPHSTTLAKRTDIYIYISITIPFVVVGAPLGRSVSSSLPVLKMLTIKRVATVVSNYQEDDSDKGTLGCGRNCLGSCCLPGLFSFPIFLFSFWVSSS